MGNYIKKVISVNLLVLLLGIFCLLPINSALAAISSVTTVDPITGITWKAKVSNDSEMFYLAYYSGGIWNEVVSQSTTSDAVRKIVAIDGNVIAITSRSTYINIYKWNGSTLSKVGGAMSPECNILLELIGSSTVNYGESYYAKLEAQNAHTAASNAYTAANSAKTNAVNAYNKSQEVYDLVNSLNLDARLTNIEGGLISPPVIKSVKTLNNISVSTTGSITVVINAQNALNYSASLDNEAEDWQGLNTITVSGLTVGANTIYVKAQNGGGLIDEASLVVFRL